MLRSSSYPYQHRIAPLKDLNYLIQKLPIKDFFLWDDFVNPIKKDEKQLASR